MHQGGEETMQGYKRAQRGANKDSKRQAKSQEKFPDSEIERAVDISPRGWKGMDGSCGSPGRTKGRSREQPGWAGRPVVVGAT